MRRLNPFDGMRVSLFDATYASEETATAVKQRINSDLYNDGVVNGLTVAASVVDPGAVYVTPGVAYDINGERIAVPVLEDRIRYSGALLNSTAAVYRVAARYVEGNDGTSGLDVTGLSQFRHIMDDYDLVVLKVGADTAQSADVILTQVTVTAQGSTLIFDNSVRDTFSAKYAATGTNLNAADVYIGGSLVVGGCVTSLLGGCFMSLSVMDGGFKVTGTACFFRDMIGMSNITLNHGDFIAPAGKGIIVVSPDGTKRARIGLGDDGFQSFTPLNYTLI